MMTEPAFPERLRSTTWPVWFAWVLSSALGPVFITVAATAFGKQVAPTAAHPALITAGLLALALIATLAPPIMQGLTIRRILPKLRLWVWFKCVLVWCIAWLLLTNLIEAGFQTQSALQNAALTQRLAGTLTTARILHLPWGPFLLWTMATSALTSLVLVCGLGSASGRWWAALLFWAAAIIGSCGSGVVEQLYGMLLNDRIIGKWALNGLSWTERFQIVAARFGVGAVWGAAAAIPVVMMTRRSTHGKTPGARSFSRGAAGLALMLIAALLIAALAPLVGYLAGPRGVVAGAPELRRAISLAPSQDRSQGETVLAFSHKLAVAVARTPPGEITAAIAPDGWSAIVRTVDHTLMQMDLASGSPVRQLGDALAPLERYAIAWSPNGRYLALRSNGAEVTLPGTRYKRRQSRIRLYALPDLTLAGEFSNKEGYCFDREMLPRAMEFSSDGKSLWLVCDPYAAQKPDDLMAIGLDVPSMQAHDARYGDWAESGRVSGLESVGDSVWAWQFAANTAQFRVRDLTDGREIVKLAMPVGLTSSLSSNPFMNEKNIRLELCETPAGAASARCRALVFDTKTGALLDSIDEGEQRIPISATGRPQSILSSAGFRIESFWQEHNKTGELVIRDSATGRERQRIVSVAQRLVQSSPDGRWLITVAVNGGSMRMYRLRR